MKNTPWRGVIIAESFEKNDVIERSRTVRTKTEILEGEEGRGRFHFHLIEVPDCDVELLVDTATQTIKPAWYIHLVRDGQMYVVYRNKYFKLTQGDDQATAEAKEHAISCGIHPDQIAFERFFDNPYDE
ncbi:hypothetical protein [Nocardia sp. BMG51109]|uniref:hypothetical protein n=1 Tax=Nocardia sp. BMG51109 TaxID=1056816 RepID=UPI0012EC2254|nr:hypothetical protein [Nocardia sp. BMG51109]